MKHLNRLLTLLFTIILFSSCATKEKQVEKLDINTWLELADANVIYPTQAQIAMLERVIPDSKYQPAPPVSDRAHWNEIAQKESGQEYLKEAISLLDKKPEIPIADEIYYRANREGNRGIYKPRYYRTMDRLEKFILGECIENRGRFLPQIEVYCDSIIAMKSWLHPNHDRDNDVLEGRRVSIDLGARKFGLVLALADALLEDRLPEILRSKIAEQLQWRIMDSYLRSCKLEEDKSNHWIRATSNWNSVCTSGTIFTTIVKSENYNERVAAIGCAINCMVFYLSGFGSDGYCSEGTGYWNYGFGHYLYLAEILYDYTEGKINLFDFNDPVKLKNVAHFPETFQIHEGMYAPFSDGVTRIKSGSDNFAYLMAAKYYGAKKPAAFIPDESVQRLLGWSGLDSYVDENDKSPLPEYTYFDDFGIVISRGQQQKPFSIAIKAGHNAENHNHMDVGSYVLVLDQDYIAGDIGAPSYIAGAFSDDNPARSSWGHPVPRLENTLQSKGEEFRGEILETSFTAETDKVVMDIKPAYHVEGLQKLVRTMENNKTGDGTITIKDEFSASNPVQFGTAVMVNVAYQIVNDNTVLVQSENQKVEVKIITEGASVKISDEVVPVEHLRSGKKSYRIGIDFTEKVKNGMITVTYKPL
ncbi:heparinase II/III family protein [uncultured Draconibacterium sp.]|uniref:heparinase II/III family protein n=1 Tax=uncultured Draconibacterium sp. TaxID=1573823 RepID=UPI003261628B